MARRPDGTGIALASNYLWYTDPNFDSGLCDTLASGGARRPAYTTWGGLRSFALARPRRATPPALVAFVALLAVAPGARAATARISPTGGTVDYAAAPGEANGS